LLNAHEIGITLPVEDQLDPEQSTSAIVVHQPLGNILGIAGDRMQAVGDQLLDQLDAKSLVLDQHDTRLERLALLAYRAL